ncbi:hypothetical protein EDD16DRAFT_442739 [Pisolithus croceorrhizus]|nr:hypothetical protein EDD16DRAFT_442739 [Pisolithus croceorrhizus]KAI6135165.1 hypothetical protein EV401DRAFT_885333 [Pisolithus croceorrhizus]
MSKRPTPPLQRWSAHQEVLLNLLLRKETVVSTSGDERQKGLTCSVKRTSNLEARIISLSSARSGEIVSCRFDPTAQNNCCMLDG